MNELLTALKEGKTLIWKSQFPRYYKLVNDEIIYSDDLEQWLTSNLTPEQVAEIKELEILI